MQIQYVRLIDSHSYGSMIDWFLFHSVYKKHHPPSLDDEVWRLERIAKGGASHKRLDSNRICNVRDFLRLSVIDPSLLRKVRKILFLGLETD